MKNIKVVIGTLFGDEGKGLFTDYFCSKQPCLNVRYNGTAQASHTVHFKDKKHIFKTIGAGSFNPFVDTYLAKEFVLNPIILKQEFQTLLEYGIKPIIYINKNCRIATPFDMLLNQQIERERKVRHGSCGYGFFETIKRYKNTSHYFYINDLNIEEKLNEINNSDLDLEALKINFFQDLMWVKSYCHIVDDSVLNKYDHIVFEGAQGLSLCEDNLKYFPNLTPSQTGIKYVSDILENVDFKFNLEICYVLRSYATRHGNGELPHECIKEYLGEKVEETTNVFNESQGMFRFGWLDLGEVIDNIETDLQKLNKNITYQLSLGITHLDQTGNFLRTYNGNMEITEFISILNSHSVFKNNLKQVYLVTGNNANYIKRTMYQYH